MPQTAMPSLVLTAGVFALLWLLEFAIPYYPWFTHSMRERLRHDGRNLFVGAINVATVTILGSVAGFAVGRSTTTSIGEGVAAFILLDFAMFMWHWASHRLSFLWRFHRTHHADDALNVSSAVRFHLGEVLLSNGYRTGIALAFGLSADALIFYQTAFLMVVYLQHSNVSIPEGLERALAWLIITPAAHRVHHGQLHVEMNSNFGSVLVVWDCLFGLRLRKKARDLVIGLEGWSSKDETLLQLLFLPVRPVNQSLAASDTAKEAG